MDNYENADGVSLPRSTLYNHYMHHCNEHKLDAVNAASFGKLIRSVFTGLRTRRLGTRGNSKYHYYGIRVKPGSGLVGAGSSDDSAVVVTTVSSKAGLSSTTGSCGVPTTAAATNSTTGGGIHQRVRKSGGHGIKPETYEACSQFLGEFVLLHMLKLNKRFYIIIYHLYSSFIQRLFSFTVNVKKKCNYIISSYEL